MFERLNHAARQIIVHTTQGNTFILKLCVLSTFHNNMISTDTNHIGVVMINKLALSTVDHGFKPRSDKNQKL